jgi:chromosome segregation ATPase
MSGKTWVLKGVDPAQRQLVREAAAREGLSVAEYLARALQRSVESEQYAESPAQQTDRPSTLQRLDSVERRVNKAVGGIDESMRSLDGSLLQLAARLDDAESLSQDTAQAVSSALAQFSDGLDALRLQADRTAAETYRLRQEHDHARADSAETHAALHDEIGQVGDIARHAESAALDAKQAHDALAARLRAQIVELASAADETIEEGLASARAAAEAAAQSAEDALGEALDTMRHQREAIERRIAEAEADAAERAQDVMAQSEARAAIIAASLGDTDGRVETIAQNVEDNAFAIDELKSANASLRADLAEEIARAESGARAAANTAASAMRREIEASLAALRQDQHAAAARLQRIDDALGGAAALIDAPVCERLNHLETEIAARVRESAELESALDNGLRRLNADLRDFAARPVSNLDASLRARLDDLTERLGDQEQEGAAAAAKAHDLEQCLETLGRHIAENAAQSETGLAKLESTLTELARHAAAAASPADLEAKAAQLEQRLEAKLAATFEAQIEQALALRLETFERATADQLANERSAYSELAGEARAANTEALDALAQRLADFEAAQTQRADTLFDEFTHLSDALGQRLHSVEQFVDAAPAEVAREEITQLLAAFDSRLNDFERRDAEPAQRALDEVELMRQRFEERLTHIERRSVQAIERITETVAALTQRAHPPEDEYVLDLVERVEGGAPQTEFSRKRPG